MKKFIFGTFMAAVTLFFVSCGDLLRAITEPSLDYDFYTKESYINGVLVTISKDRVENADSFVLYYDGTEVTEFEDSIFIPATPNKNGTEITGYSVRAKNKKSLSDEEQLDIQSTSYILNKDYNVILTQSSEDYNSITFDWEFKGTDYIKFYDYEKSKLECLIGTGHYDNDFSEMKGEDIGNNQVVLKDLKPASVYSCLYGCLIYSYTDLMGEEHNNIITELNTQSESNKNIGHTKILDKIENVSVSFKRTSAVISYNKLTEEQLHGLSNKDYSYYVLITNEDDSNAKPEKGIFSAEKATGKDTITGLKPETNYKFEICASASYDYFQDYADMAKVTGKTDKALAALSAPTLTESEPYDKTTFKTKFTVAFDKHPYDTAEHPMKYQVEYYLFKTSSPNKYAKDYFDYPDGGSVTIEDVNAGNTYKVVVKAIDVADPENPIVTDVKTIKTERTEGYKSLNIFYHYSFTSAGSAYNWGTMNGTFIPNGYTTIDISGLYEYSSPKILAINASTNTTMTLSGIPTKMGHFDVLVCNPAREKVVKLNTLSRTYLQKTPEEAANIYGNYIQDSYVFNDCLYFAPDKQYSSLYDDELTEEYKVGITFVAK